MGTSALERSDHTSMVTSFKMLCHRKFQDTHGLKKKFNVKRYDKKSKSKEEFEGQSYFASSSK